MNKISKMIAALVLSASVAMPMAVQAQGQGPVTLSSDVKALETVTDAAGNEIASQVEPGVIVPGDRLIFGTDYSNTGDEVVTDFVVMNVVPAAVQLAPDADSGLTVSVDTGSTWGPLSSLSVTAEDGMTRAAVAADVTHVRWTLVSIAPGETGRLEYPAIIR